MRRLVIPTTRRPAIAHSTRASGGEPRAGLAELTQFGSNPGALKAWLHVPASLQPGAGLVVVLHGCTQSAASYDHGSGWSTLADRYGFAVLLPEQQRANNPNGCFNWFVPADTRRGSGEALSIHQMITAAVDTHDLNPTRVFITGLSAGGAMASAMLATYPEVFAGGAIVAGLPFGTAKGVPEALDRMRGHGGPRGAGLAALVRAASDHGGPWPTISVWHGSADRTVAPHNATQIVDQWLGVHGVEAPLVRDVIMNFPHLAWRDPSGKVVVEQFEITGMGHGTPLRTTGGGDAIGVAGPFMLEAGISSTHHLARAWGIIDMVPVVEHLRDAPADRPATSNRVWFDEPARVIDDALRAAGLVR